MTAPTTYDFFHYITLTDGREFGWGIIVDPVNGIDAAVVLRQPWSKIFNLVEDLPIYGDDATAIEDILRTLGIWNTSYNGKPTWAALYAGGSFVDTDGQTYTGEQAIVKLFGDFLASTNDFGALQSTATWSTSKLLTKMQQALNLAITNNPVVPAPTMPTFPPGGTGIILNVITLCQADNTLLEGKLDPTGLGIIVTEDPVPHS